MQLATQSLVQQRFPRKSSSSELEERDEGQIMT